MLSTPDLTLHITPPGRCCHPLYGQGKGASERLCNCPLWPSARKDQGLRPVCLQSLCSFSSKAWHIQGRATGYLTHACLPSSLHGTWHIVGHQKLWLSRKCGHNHQEHCEFAGSQDMLVSEDILPQECNSLTFQRRKLRLGRGRDISKAGEGTGHLQGHGTLS